MSHQDAAALDPEELAAYIDGRLSGTRKARVEETLAHNEGAYEVFLESVRTLDAEGLLDGEVVPAGPTTVATTEDVEPLPAGVVSISDRVLSLRRRIVRLAPAVGGLLAATLALTLGLRFTMGASPTDFTTKVSQEQLSQDEHFFDPGWTRYRSGDPSQDDLFSEEAIAFRLGVRGVDLRVAAEARDSEQLSQLVRNTASWARSADLTSEYSYDELAEALTESLTDEEITRRLDAADKEVTLDVADDPVMKRRYRLGLWAESGRLAARAGDVETLRARRFRWHRTVLASDDPKRDTATSAVAAIKQRLESETFSEAELQDLEAAFQALIRELAR